MKLFLASLLVMMCSVYTAKASNGTPRLLTNAVTLEEGASQNDPTNGSSIVFRVTFNEAVSGFAADDIDFAGSSAAGTLVAVINTVTANLEFDVVVTGMTGNGTVTAIVKSGAASLVSNNTIFTAPSTSADNVVTYDVTNPTVSSLNPTTNSTGISVTSDLEVTFNEDIDIASGTIELRRFSDDVVFESYTLPSARVTLPSSNVLRINPNVSLASNTRYYVVIPSTAVLDKAANSFAGITNKNVWNFTTVNVPPFISSLFPLDGQTNVLLSVTQLVVTFTEQVIKDGDNSDTDNQIRIRNITANTTETIDPSSSNVIISGGGNNIVTITFATPLVANTDYEVLIGNSVFKDVDNAFFNATAGEWNFKTEAGPIITGYSANPTCVGETITINGSGFGVPIPTVTINGQSATVNSHTATTISIIVPATTSGLVVVTNNANLISGNDNTLTLKPAIAASLPISSNPPFPVLSQNYDIEVGSTQNGVDYAIRELPGGFGGTTAGNGGTISFGPYNKGTDGTYSYEVRATSSGCSQETYTHAVTILQLTANAGADKPICAGGSVVLGASPTAAGGTGYHQISWNIVPPTSTFSSSSNPTVSPTVTTVYRVTVDDNSGAPVVTDDITITVNNPTPPAQLNITLTPNANSNVYSNQDPPVELTFNYTGPNPLGTGIFSGPGVNSTFNPDRFYPNAANVGLNLITLNYTNDKNCVTQKSVTVNVFDNSTNFTGFEDKYCFLDIEDGVTPTLAGYTLDDIKVWHLDYNTFSWTIDYIGISPAGVGTYNFNPLDAATGFINSSGNALVYLEGIFHNNIDILIKRSVYKGTFIYQLPKVKISNFENDDICKNESSLKISGAPVGGAWTGPGVTNAPGNNNNPSFSVGEDGVGIFNPSTANVGNNVALYSYMDENGCSSSASDFIKMNDIPVINFSFVTKCVGEEVKFIPTESLPAGVSIDVYYWDFGDDTGSKSATLEDPKLKTYNAASVYDVNLSVYASNNCIVNAPLKQITIGEIPTVDFSWRNVCEGSLTSLRGTVSGLGSSTIQSVQWDFTGGGYGAPGPATDTVKTFSYAIGSRPVKLKINTNKNCSREVEKFVYTVPSITFNQLPYRNEFDTDDGQWISGTNNATPSSWQWGTPAATLINADASGSGKAWVTNLTGFYNTNEDSWIHSPCFDLSQLERPILEMDIRSLTPEQIDGAVFQYNTKNTTDKENDWKNLGFVGQGDNWFNRVGIFSNPGNQALGQIGWSGSRDSVSWRSAKIPLDDIIASIPPAEQTKVRFRLAFSSTNFIPANEGFALDNFDIHQRERIVFIEHFTNNGGVNSPTNPNRMANTVLRTFVDNRVGEVIKLEYHLGLPGPNEDPIYESNSMDASARAAYYGVTSTPFSLVDSKSSSNISNLFTERTLKGAEVSIDTIFTPSSPSNMFNVTVAFTAIQNLPANTVLHVAVIEKVVTDAEAFGSNGESSFDYVMKKMLPDATGTLYTNPILKDEIKTQTLSWSPKAYDFNQLAVIAFVQNQTTREIYQSRILRTPTFIPDPDNVTGTESSITEDISLYPNPARGQLTIRIAKKSNQLFSCGLIDGFGRSVYTNTITPGENQKTIDTSAFASGMYVFEIKTKDGEVLRKKVTLIN